MFNKIKNIIKLLVKYIATRLKFLWRDFKKYGWKLRRNSKKEWVANFYGSRKKFPIYIKRRIKNRNFKARSLKLRQCYE